MSKYKFTTIYCLVFVAPFIGWALLNAYAWVFNIFTPSDKALDSLVIGIFLLSFAPLVYLYEDV